MSIDQRELTIIGHWPSTSRMPERYDRSVCANELLLHNTIVQMMDAGWVLAPAYHLPATRTGHVRIGKEPETLPPPATDQGALTQPSHGSDDLPHTVSAANHDSNTQQTLAIGDEQGGGELSHTPTHRRFPKLKRRNWVYSVGESQFPPKRFLPTYSYRIFARSRAFCCYLAVNCWKHPVGFATYPT